MKSFSHFSLNTQGILCLMGALVFLTLSDSIIKWLSPHYPLHEITLIRAMVAMVFVLIIVQLEGGPATLKTRRPWLHLFRGCLLVLANMFFFLGLSVMPFAQVVALFFTAPLFICLLAQPVLGETVGLTRWGGIVLGLIGVLVMAQPGTGEFSWPNVLPILAALTYAIMQMVTRKLGMRDSAGALTFYIQISFILVSGASYFLIGDGRYDTFDEPTLSFLLRAWEWPTSNGWLLLGVCGFVNCMGGYLLSQSYRLAQASVVAPFEYTSLPLAIIVGFMVWGDIPKQAEVLGSALIIAGGILVMYFESKSPVKITRRN